jgi:NitT/TauT family transport system substrate-binding protein
MTFLLRFSAATASLAVAAALTIGASQAQDLKEITVVVPNPSAINNFALHVAKAGGYLEEEGLSGARKGFSPSTVPRRYSLKAFVQSL